MKNLFLFLSILTIAAQADLSTKQIENMVYKIHQKREGIGLKTLEETKEPFVRFKKDDNVSSFVSPVVQMEEEKKLALHAIMNGKAYINDGWVKKDDVIFGYKLKYIGKKGVVLRNENHIKKLFLHKQDNNLIKFEER